MSAVVRGASAAVMGGNDVGQVEAGRVAEHVAHPRHRHQREPEREDHGARDAPGQQVVAEQPGEQPAPAVAHLHGGRTS